MNLGTHFCQNFRISRLVLNLFHPEVFIQRLREFYSIVPPYSLCDARCFCLFVGGEEITITKNKIQEASLSIL